MARKKQAIPQHIRREVVRRDKGICRYCGKQGGVKWQSPKGWVWIEHEFDHVYPEILGGETTTKNIVIACRSCNRRKGNKTLSECGMILLEVKDYGTQTNDRPQLLAI